MTTYAKVLIRCKTTGRFLFQLRDNKPGVANPGLWGLLGGSDDEVPESAEKIAVREVLEETGIHLDNLKRIGVCPTIAWYSDGRPTIVCDLVIFLSIVPNEHVPFVGEGEAVEWKTLDEFFKLPMTEGLLPFLKKHRTEIEQ